MLTSKYFLSSVMKLLPFCFTDYSEFYYFEGTFLWAIHNFRYFCHILLYSHCFSDLSHWVASVYIIFFLLCIFINYVFWQYSKYSLTIYRNSLSCYKFSYFLPRWFATQNFLFAHSNHTLWHFAIKCFSSSIHFQFCKTSTIQHRLSEMSRRSN